MPDVQPWHDVKVGPGPQDPRPRDPGTWNSGPPLNFISGTPRPLIKV